MIEFGKRNRTEASRRTKLDQERERPFTIADIQGHLNGTAPHNTLSHLAENSPAQKAFRWIQEILDQSNRHSDDIFELEKALKALNNALGRVGK